MKITNAFGLPQSFVDAVSDQREHKRGFISVTELLSPPQQRSLELQHWDELTADAADQVQRFLGTAAHERLAKYGEGWKEFTLEMPCLGWTVHGTIDLWENNAVTDYKTTTVRGLKYDKPEWEQQLNLYGHLLRYHDTGAAYLTVVVLLRDWERFNLADDAYPRQPIVQVPVRLWDAYEAQAYMEERVKLHKAAARGFYPACTDEERWMRGVFTVTKKGNSRATKTFETREEALSFASSKLDPIQEIEDWFEIEYRPGQPLRCLGGYCVAAPMCEQHADWRAAQPQEAAVVFDG